MARVDNSFDFLSPKQRKRPEKYPWDQWLDGQKWRLTIGEDFNARSGNPGAFRNTVNQAARRKGLVVRSSVDGDDIIIQAYRPEDEED